MQDYQNCQFVGRLVKDPEVRYGGDSQQAIASFTLAVNRGKDKQGEDKGADFPKFKAFGKTAENIEKLCHKGDRILVQRSHFHTDSYMGKDGQKVYTNDFIVDDWTIMQIKDDGGAW